MTDKITLTESQALIVVNSENDENYLNLPTIDKHRTEVINNVFIFILKKRIKKFLKLSLEF